MTRERAKNIGDDDIAAIVGMLDGWSGKLSWELLIDVIQKRTRARYTRQALHRHERIRSAFSLRKKSLAGSVVRSPDLDMSPELKAALDLIDRLRAENQRLKAEAEQLLEQFARWAYNAHTRNLSEGFLNTPLPKPDREQTELAGRRGKSRKLNIGS